MKKISISPFEMPDSQNSQKLKLFLSLTLSFSTLSVSKSWNSFSLPQSPSQLPLTGSGGYENSLSSSCSLRWLQEPPLFLSLAPVVTTRLVTPVTTGNQVKKFLCHLPFNFRNFGFGFGFPKVDFLQLVGLFLRLSSTPSPHQFHLFSLPVTATSHHFIFLKL